MALRSWSAAAGVTNVANPAGGDRQRRRREVEAALRRTAVALRPARPTPPPEGRLGVGEDDGLRLRDTLIALGPVFAGFGRYLAERFDLVPRRTRAELDAIPDEGDAIPPAVLAALIDAQLGAPPDRLFFEFHPDPIDVRLFGQRHVAWLSPGVPVSVTVIRPDAAFEIDRDVPLLTLVRDALAIPGLSVRALAAAVDDYATTLRRRLDQAAQASALSSLAADARRGGGFEAPICYRDYCAQNVLTTEHVAGEPLDIWTGAGSREPVVRRLTTAWLRQAFSGSVVPYDFSEHDVVLAGDRLVLTAAAFEPHPAFERARFAAYISAVASDNPDAAATWILDSSTPTIREETRLRRALRQAVPFRDGEWSGDDRLAEHVLVQWRVAAQSDWEIAPHHQHLYRGLHALARIAEHLAPEADTLVASLDEERMRIGIAQAGNFMDPDNLEGTLARVVQELVLLPQRIDDVLARAAEGRLRTKLQVPESDEHEDARNRTVLLVTALVAFGAAAVVLRHIQPAFGPGADRIGALLLLVLGGWLLVAAARL